MRLQHLCIVTCAWAEDVLGACRLLSVLATSPLPGEAHAGSGLTAFSALEGELGP